MAFVNQKPGKVGNVWGSGIIYRFKAKEKGQLHGHENSAISCMELIGSLCWTISKVPWECRLP